MLNELYTFAEPVQVVPFSSLKWGKFTLLHTIVKTPFVDYKCICCFLHLDRDRSGPDNRWRSLWRFCRHPVVKNGRGGHDN